MAEAERMRLDNGARQPGERQDGEQLPERIEALAFLLARRLGRPPGEQRRQEADWQVDEEDEAPGAGRQQEAAQHRPGREADAARCRPEADGLHARGRVVLGGVVDQRQRAGQHHGGADALQRPGRHKRDDVGREAAERRSEAKSPTPAM